MRVLKLRLLPFSAMEDGIDAGKGEGKEAIKNSHESKDDGGHSC